MNKPKIIVICGPTGSGKTSLAVSLCKKFGGEIVNADSRQVYRELNIGTGKELDQIFNFQFSIFNQCPTNQFSIKGIPIHLVNILNPDEKYTVGRFKKDAEVAIADIILRGKIPFIVGGTGMYIDALVENFKFPMSNDKSMSNNQISNGKNISVETNGRSSKLEMKELPDLIKQLGELDPQALNVVDLKNRRRVERAIEVCLTTGIPFTQQRLKGERQYDVLKLSPEISLHREKLFEKIDKRVDEMIEQGLEREVKMLADKYGWESEAMTGIGYKEWRTFFEKDKCQITNDKQNPNFKFQIANEIQDIISQIKLSTKKYAKRQMTWFKRPARNALARNASHNDASGSHSDVGGDKEIHWVYPARGGAEKLVKDFLAK